MEAWALDLSRKMVYVERILNHTSSIFERALVKIGAVGFFYKHSKSTLCPNVKSSGNMFRST